MKPLLMSIIKASNPWFINFFTNFLAFDFFLKQPAIGFFVPDFFKCFRFFFANLMMISSFD